jgi:hypothetical protein
MVKQWTVSNTIYNFFKYKLIFFKGGASTNGENSSTMNSE